jgi:hypothetical protein
MPIARVEMPDGSIGRFDVPEGTTPQQVEAFVLEQSRPSAPESTGFARAGNIAAGAVRGAADIGATLLAPIDAAARAAGVQSDIFGRSDRRQEVDQALKAAGADPSSIAYAGGKLATNIAGTAGVGGLLAKGASAIPVVAQYAPKLSAALESGGFSLGNAPPATGAVGTAANAATRAGAGATVGGASAGLVNPEDAATGAVVGGAFPVAAKVAGTAGAALSPKVSPEVVALYQKAKALGIDIPADRIANNRPLNAVASSLNYVPLSGRAGAEEKMLSQVNRAVSRTFGQDSDNVTGALRKAESDLGTKFEQTLSTNTVKVDNQLLNELVAHLQTADKELGAEGARIIGKQIDEIMNKAGANGEIDGQAAYNIKKALDRIGNRNANEAYYARELKKSLMGALNRSLGPAEAAEFATVRKQYGNMLELQNLAQNGAEGGISIGRLANLKHINNPELQDIADIAAQFVRTRENPHGAAQRVVLGAGGLGLAGATGTLPALAGGVAAGRIANTALNSNALKALFLDPPVAGRRVKDVVGSPAFRALVYESPSATSP